MEEPVILKLSLESMRHEMIHAFSQHTLELKQSIDDACTNFIESGKLQQQVQECFNAAVHDELASYFKYGEGREAVKNAVELGMKQIIKRVKK